METHSRSSPMRTSSRRVSASSIVPFVMSSTGQPIDFAVPIIPRRSGCANGSPNPPKNRVGSGETARTPSMIRANVCARHQPRRLVPDVADARAAEQVAEGCRLDVDAGEARGGPADGDRIAAFIEANGRAVDEPEPLGQLGRQDEMALFVEPDPDRVRLHRRGTGLLVRRDRPRAARPALVGLVRARPRCRRPTGSARR